MIVLKYYYRNIVLQIGQRVIVRDLYVEGPWLDSPNLRSTEHPWNPQAPRWA